MIYTLTMSIKPTEWHALRALYTNSVNIKLIYTGTPLPLVGVINTSGVARTERDLQSRTQ